MLDDNEYVLDNILDKVVPNVHVMLPNIYVGIYMLGNNCRYMLGRKGGKSQLGTEASVVALTEVPSPHTMRDNAGLGLTKPYIVGLIPRPAPESMMTCLTVRLT